MINRIRPFPILICSLLMTFTSYAQQIEVNGFTMGTYYAIKYIDNDHLLPAEVAQKEIDKKLERVNDQMSTYRPNSELSRFNSSIDIDKPFSISDDLAFVIKASIEINSLTKGGLDITIGPLVNLWGFGPEEKKNRIPSKEEIEKSMITVGINKLIVNGNTLMKRTPGLYLDLSAIAKGYGVDVIGNYLQSQGINHYMVDIGGEIQARGKNQRGEFWRIAIEKPGHDLNRQVYEIIQLNNQSVATSGSYRNYFDDKNHRYSHTIDPKTGFPIDHKIVSVSVIHSSCMYADGLATGFYVLGVEESIRLANKLDIPVMIIVDSDDGLKDYHSDAFNRITGR